MIENGTWLVSTQAILYHEDGIERADGAVPAIRAKLDAARRTTGANMKRAVASGVNLAVGTDSVHGTMAFEIAKLVEYGATPLAALTAATLNGARVCGIEADTGSLEAGKRADVISVRGNPLEDIERMWDVHLVMKSGERLDGLSAF